MYPRRLQSLTEQDQQWKIGSKCNNQCTVTYRGQMPHDYLYRLRKKYQMPTLFYNKKASTRNRKRFLQLDKNYI